MELLEETNNIGLATVTEEQARSFYEKTISAGTVMSRERMHQGYDSSKASKELPGLRVMGKEQGVW